MARIGPARQAGHGEAGRGLVRQARRGEAWQGAARRGKAGKARWGMDRQGRAWQGRQGMAGQGLTRQGRQHLIQTIYERQIMSKRKIQQIKFAFRDGRNFGVSADVAGHELERIAQRDGTLQAQAVVDESRPATAPLHPIFEWDDEAAAENYRRHQARSLIKAVQVIHQESKAQEPVYVHVPAQEGRNTGGYMPTAVVVQRLDLYASALDDLLKRTKAAESAARTLQDVAKQQDDADSDRFACITIALQALHTANSAVQALQ